jgi:hypothetical protein
MRHFPRYGIVGLFIMLISEIGMLLQIEPFWSWHTPTAWTGYILFVDAWVWKRRGNSWLTTARAEFAFLAAMSVPLWLVFEWYNKYFLHNWYYINLPDNLALRYFGYVWSFATIWPAIFETGDLVASFRRAGRPAVSRAGFGGRQVSMIAIGLVLLVWPIVWPSPYLAAPVWLGFIFLLDPLNAIRGGESLTRQRAISLAAAGLICGVVWEFWNYWSRTKWIYAVPILPELKIFEMPVLGYGGFPAFALECFTMYVTASLAFWRGARRSISV